MLIGSIGCVLQAQQAPKEEKGKWMFRHKSLGLLTGIILGPRLVVKLMSKSPVPLAGSSVVEGWLAKANHFALYGFTTTMASTGIAMGLTGGNGLPFFYTTIPALPEKNKEVAGLAFKIHKQVGYYGKFLVPLHVGAAGYHVARGHSILQRVNPFGKM